MRNTIPPVKVSKKIDRFDVIKAIGSFKENLHVVNGINQNMNLYKLNELYILEPQFRSEADKLIKNFWIKYQQTLKR